MPSTKPRIATYTTENNIRKLKVLSAQNNKSMSEYLNFLIEKAIQDHENKHGEITVNQEQA